MPRCFAGALALFLLVGCSQSIEPDAAATPESLPATTAVDEMPGEASPSSDESSPAAEPTVAAETETIVLNVPGMQ